MLAADFPLGPPSDCMGIEAVLFEAVNGTVRSVVFRFLVSHF